MSNASETHKIEPELDGSIAEVDISLLEDSLAMTPWERMQANDDAVNFADTLSSAMQERHAKSG